MCTGYSQKNEKNYDYVVVSYERSWIVLYIYKNKIKVDHLLRSCTIKCKMVYFVKNVDKMGP